MIINRDMKPERQIYHLGGRLIEVLKEAPEKQVEPLRAFEMLSRKESVSMTSFILALDWLFMIGVVDQQKGRIVKCF